MVTNLPLRTFFVLPTEEVISSLTDWGSIGLASTGLLLLTNVSTGLLVVKTSCLLESCAGVSGTASLTGTVCNLPVLSDNG